MSGLIFCAGKSTAVELTSTILRKLQFEVHSDGGDDDLVRPIEAAAVVFDDSADRERIESFRSHREGVIFVHMPAFATGDADYRELRERCALHPGWTDDFVLAAAGGFCASVNKLLLGTRAAAILATYRRFQKEL